MNLKASRPQGGKPSKTVGAFGAHRNRAGMLDWQGFDAM